MTVDEFRDKFERVSEPCILTGLTDHWEAQKRWTIEVITGVEIEDEIF